MSNAECLRQAGMKNYDFLKINLETETWNPEKVLFSRMLARLNEFIRAGTNVRSDGLAILKRSKIPRVAAPET